MDDDSPDGTAEVVRAGSPASELRCIQRIGRRGLASACVEGVLSSAAPYVAIMDADLQHDEGLPPTMLRMLAISLSTSLSAAGLQPAPISPQCRIIASRPAVWRSAWRGLSSKRSSLTR